MNNVLSYEGERVRESEREGKNNVLLGERERE
jgi:hypothetical protein